MNLEHWLPLLPKHLHRCHPYKGGYKSCCPYHDEATGSFFVYEKEGWWFQCFGCGKAGHLLTLLAYFGYDVPAPPKRITSNSLFYAPSPAVHRRDATRGFPFTMGYFKSRGISEEVARRFRFKMDFDYPRAVFPIDYKGRYHGMICRSLRPDGPRYMIEAGLDVGGLLWGIDEVNKDEPTYIVEGIIDAATLWSGGHQAVALMGKQWKRKTHILTELKHPIAVPDNYDRTSFARFREMARTIGAQMVYVPHPHKDVNDCWLAKELPAWMSKS